MGIGGIIGAAAASGAGNILGGYLQGQNQRDLLKKQYAMQKEFAKHGITWKVEDAKRAGIHPLFALGASTHSYKPQYVGSNDLGLAKTGQDISRAILSAKTQPQRQIQALEIEFLKEKIRGQKIENDKSQTNQIGPPLPLGTDESWKYIPGQTGSEQNIGFPSTLQSAHSPTGVNITPKTQTHSQSMGVESGFAPMEQLVSRRDGYMTFKPGKEIAEILESSWFDQAEYMMFRGTMKWNSHKYYIYPGEKNAAKWRELIRKWRPKKAPSGFEWRYNPFKVGYKLHKKDGVPRLYEVPRNHPMAKFGYYQDTFNFGLKKSH